MLRRLEEIVPMRDLNGVRILITGCGYKPLLETFRDYASGEPSHDPLYVGGVEMKLNIGAATAGVLLRHGATVHMVSRSEEKLETLKKKFWGLALPDNIEYSAVDLLDEGDVTKFIKGLPMDMPLSWVQSIGLGSGAYKVQDDNPYLQVDQIPIELLEQETGTVLRGTHLLMQGILPIFRKQAETKVAIISSMSAIRGYSRGCTHCAAKAALSRYTNSAMIALWKEKIFVTDIRPGAIDTGLYDSRIVQTAIHEISDEYGGIHRDHFCVAPPSSVGKAVAYAFTCAAHIPSITLVARGQFPNEGS